MNTGGGKLLKTNSAAAPPSASSSCRVVLRALVASLITQRSHSVSLVTWNFCLYIFTLSIFFSNVVCLCCNKRRKNSVNFFITQTLQRREEMSTLDSSLPLQTQSELKASWNENVWENRYGEHNIIALVGLWQGFFIVVESIFIIAEVFKILEKNGISLSHTWNRF